MEIELLDDAVPDETTILKLQHLLEHHGLAAALFEDINALLIEQKLLLRQGTLVDADDAQRRWVRIP